MSDDNLSELHRLLNLSAKVKAVAPTDPWLRRPGVARLLESIADLRGKDASRPSRNLTVVLSRRAAEMLGGEGALRDPDQRSPQQYLVCALSPGGTRDADEIGRILRIQLLHDPRPM